MNTKTVLRALVGTAAALGLSVAVYGQSARAQGATGEGHYAPVNGLELYYEIHGEGEPLIVLHGGLGGIVEYAQLLPLLAETRQVIAVELQAHGHTADIDRPLSFEAMADDIAALIEYLGFENADVMGFSTGGGVALQTAIRHPEVVRKLIVISPPFKRSGIHPEFLAGMGAMNAEAAAMMHETPMYQFYSSVAPDVDNWPTLVQKTADLMAQDYDWSAEVANLTMPVLIILGDSDFIPVSHAVELFGLLGGNVAGGMVPQPIAQLAVLPNTIHYTILTRTDLLIPLINPFLDGSTIASPMG